ncbi:sulfatase [Fulvivirga sp. M361]|uniref:sulfatase family protein n=1 Tax=Fulvivirga sp. M361 TaxID=2594266 RepID=UPI00210394B3|nr:sulfatase [Fulvivirga sp. M361]
MKNSLILLSIYLLVSVSCSRYQETEDDLPPPNILWIVSEDNSPWLGCYGDSVANTPRLDALAAEGILFSNAYSNAPVCAPSRFTLITGTYPIAFGTEHMRSTYKIPQHIRFYPHYLKEAGYYTSNNSKKDYNTVDQPEVWNVSSKEASYHGRKEGQPFFHIVNLMTTHESRLHRDSIARHDPESVDLAPYHPDVPEMRNDYAVYYDRIEEMDQQVGKILDQLASEGLSENTIVFYYSDHGGAMAGTKRYATQAGLHVPLIVRVPKKYQGLTPYPPGSKLTHPVSFIDLAPTLLHLAGLAQPAAMEGRSILKSVIGKSYAYAFAGRMDERTNFVRSVTDGNYRYTRNYLPHRPYGQHLETLWKAQGMKAWAKAYQSQTLDKTRSAFFEPRASEELYDLGADPYCINNLINDVNFEVVRKRLSDVLTEWQVAQRDAGFIPEAKRIELDKNETIHHYTHSDRYPVKDLIGLAQKAGERNPANLSYFVDRLTNTDPVTQYWATTGILMLKEKASGTRNDLLKALDEAEPSTGIVIAETLYGMNDQQKAIAYLRKQLSSDRIMIRVQALNAIDHMEGATLKMLPELKALVPENLKKRPYDVRIARSLIKKSG